MNKFLLFFAFIFSSIAVADIEVPDAVMQQIIADVMADEGGYDAAEIDFRVREWQINQPPEDSSGEVTNSGSCSESCVQSGGNDALPMPRNVKIKGREVNGSLDKHIVITWKRPPALPEGSDLQLKNYRVILAKDGQTFKKYKVKAKFRANGKPKVKQKLKLRNLEDGNYTVQVRAKYKSTSSSLNSKASTLAGTAETSSGGMNSGWSGAESGIVESTVTWVGDLQPIAPNLYQCIVDHQYTNLTDVTDVTNIICTNKGLVNDDLVGLQYLSGLVQLGLKDNIGISDTTFMSYKSLSSLTWLDLSGNVNLDIETGDPLSELSALEILVLRNMQLENIPAIPETVTFLNLNDNNLENNDRFPAETSLETLVIDRNKNSSGQFNLSDSFFLAMGDLDIRTIKVRQSALTNVSAFEKILGLENLVLRGGNLESVQDFRNLSGFCSLNISDSPNIAALTYSRPVQFLELNNNPLLGTVSLLNSPDFRPVQTNISGTNNLICGTYYEYLDNTAPEFNHTSWVTPPFQLGNGNDPVIPLCPATAIMSIINLPDQCKPNAFPASLFGVYSDDASNRHYIDWEQNKLQDYARWGVTHLKIISFINGAVVEEYLVDLTDDTSFIVDNTSGLLPDEYQIKACTDFQCGHGNTRVSAPFAQGLVSPTFENVNWTLIDPDGNHHFTIKFSYPQFNGKGKPNRFEIHSTMPQSNGSYLVTTVDVPETGLNPVVWNTAELRRDEVIGTSFYLKACRDDIGCSLSVPLNITQPTIDATVELPNFEQFSVEQVNGQLKFRLDWSFDDNTLVGNVDYIEIVEYQPRRKDDDFAHHIIPAFDKDDSDLSIITTHQVEKGSIELSRLAEGHYQYRLRACRKTETLDECTTETSPVQITLSRNDVVIDDTFSPYFLAKPLEPIFANDDDNERQLQWQMPPENDVTPEYFIIKSFPYRSNFQEFNRPKCQLTIDGVLVDVDTIKVDANQFSNNLNSVWTTVNVCHKTHVPVMNAAHPYGHWSIQACVNGVGCTEPLKFCDAGDLSNPNSGDQRCTVETGQQAVSQYHDISSSYNSIVSGGPGSLSPGSFWNEDLDGTGWHFFWVNGLNQTAQDGRYGRTYDLVGYWFAYREVDGNWTPTWYEARLKKAHDSQGHEVFAGNLYHHNWVKRLNDPDDYPNGGYTEELEVAYVQLSIGHAQTTNANSNRHATLTLDVDYIDGIFSQRTVADNDGPYEVNSTGQLVLLIEDIAITNMNNSYSPNNDDDHYQGLWQHGITVAEAPLSGAKVSMLTWIQGGLENSLFATFDEAGAPVWLASQTCGDLDVVVPFHQACTPKTHGGYFDDFLEDDNGYTLRAVKRGYNPIGHMPKDYVLEANLKGVGNFGRQFFDPNHPEKFKDGQFWLNATVDLPMEGVPDRNLDLDFGAVNGMLDIEKRANFHGIFYDLVGYEFTENRCDPNRTGPCEVLFSYYTDDYFAFEENGQTQVADIIPMVRRGLNEPYQELIFSPYCESPTFPDGQNSQYQVIGFKCTFLQDGSYYFQLHKRSYDDPSQTVPIAQAEQPPLWIEVCASANGCAHDIDPPTAAADPVMVGDEYPNAVLVHEPGIGPIPGSGDVSGGAATYHVPLFIPPGRNGMQPDLSINYSSKGGNGEMGVGWSVSAGSAITRCGQTVAQDTQFHAVDYTDNDRLCLDGQKLKVVNGSYWSDATQTEYRTELDSFARIKPSGDDFIVHTKSGYKNTYEPFGEAGADNTYATWMLTRSEDVHGNFIMYHYDDLNYGANEVVLKEITYTGYQQTEGSRKVRFFHDQSRTDKDLSYRFGRLYESTVKLNKIEVMLGSVKVAQYDMAYSNSHSSGHLLLDTVTEHRFDEYGNDTLGHNRELLKTTWSQNNWDNQLVTDPVTTRNFTHQNIMGAIEQYYSTGNPVPKNITNLTTSLDFNGDGIKELSFGPRNDTQTRTSGLIFLNEDGAVAKVLQSPDLANVDLRHINKFGAGDINSDGINDLIALKIERETQEFELIFYEYDTSKDINAYCNDNNADPSDDCLNHFLDYFTPHTINTGINNGDPDTVLGNLSWGQNFTFDHSEDYMDPLNSEFFVRDVNNDGLDDLVVMIQLKKHEASFDGMERWQLKNNLLVFENQSSFDTGNQFQLSFDAPSVVMGGIEPKIEREDEPGGIEMYLYDKIEFIEDFNGDGLLDIHMRRLAKLKPTWLGEDVPVMPYIVNEKIYFTNDNHVVQGSKTFAELGLTGFQCKRKDTGAVDPCSPDSIAGFGPNSFNFQDVNGDGLKDLLYFDRGFRTYNETDNTVSINKNIYRNWKVRLNTGGDVFDPNDGKIFSADTIESALADSNTDFLNFLPQGNVCDHLDASDPPSAHRYCNFVFRSSTKMGDLNADGVAEILYPNPDQLVFNRCMVTPIVNNTRSVSEGEDYCDGLSGDDQVACDDNKDHSLMSMMESTSMHPFVNDETVEQIINNQQYVFGSGGAGCLEDTCDSRPGEFPQSIPPGTFNGTGGDNASLCSRGYTDDNNEYRFDLYTEAGGLNALWDRGVYGYSALSFDIQNGQLLVTDTQDTGIYSTLFWGSAGDVTGDGLNDFTTNIGCMGEPQNYVLEGCTAAQGSQVLFTGSELDGAITAAEMWDVTGVMLQTHNKEPMPDMLTRVDVFATGDWVEWDYHSISEQLDRELELYRLPEREAGNDYDGYLDEALGAGSGGEYFYFNSSMYVVSEIRRTNGVSKLSNNSLSTKNYSSVQYGYEEAVYNNRGRGFQGFRTITTITKPDAFSDFNRMKSVSTFNQVFPLAGTLDTVETYSLGENKKISKSEYQYHNNLSTLSLKGVYFLPTDLVVQTQYGETVNEPIAVVTVDSDYDGYGNVTLKTETVTDYVDFADSRNAQGEYVTKKQVTTQTTTTTRNFDDPANNPTLNSGWWIDRLNATTVTTNIVESSNTLDDEHSVYVPQNLSRTVHSKFFWKNDSDRTLDCQFTYSPGVTVPDGCDHPLDSVDINQTLFGYDTRGNIIRTESKGQTHVIDDTGVRITDVQSRVSTTSYDGEYYFPVSSTSQSDGGNLTTTFAHNRATGQVKQTTDPNGLVSETEYDEFGLPVLSQVKLIDDTPLSAAAETAMVSCDAVSTLCTDAQNIVNQTIQNIKTKETADPTSNLDLLSGFYINGSYSSHDSAPVVSFVTETRQPGSPIIFTYHDQKGQPVLTQTEHTGGVVYALSLTNPLGQLEISTDAFVDTSMTGGLLSHTYQFNRYDEQGRLSRKRAFVGDVTGQGQACWRDTDYDTDNGFTTISARNTGANCATGIDELLMARSYDSQGKLRHTFDAKNYRTTYWYDSAGQPFIISDNMGNPIITEYDDLGRKTRVTDPNMGEKVFQYNAFGEVIIEQDAVQQPLLLGNYSYYDDLGRVTTKFWNVDQFNVPPADGLSYQDSFVYGGCGTATQLCDQYRLSNLLGGDAQNATAFNLAQHKAYQYDAFGRMLEDRVTITDLLAGLNDTATLNGGDYYVQYSYYDNPSLNLLKQTTYNREGVSVGVDAFYSVVNHYDWFGTLHKQTENPSGNLLLEITDIDPKGQVKDRLLAGAYQTTFDHYNNGQISSIKNARANGPYQQFEYQYDAWGNITRQALTDTNVPEPPSETYQYDELQRIRFSTVEGQSAIEYGYDETGGLGNLVKKTDYADTQVYGENTAGPNAITRSELNAGGTLTHQYDPKGNRIHDVLTNNVSTTDTSYVYDANNLLVHSKIMPPVGQGFSEIYFRYGVDQQRFLRYEADYDENGDVEKGAITLYAGPYFEERIDLNSLHQELKVQVSDYLSVTLKPTKELVRHYLQKDRLGSTTQIIDNAGQLIKTMSYDVFGKPRNGDDWSAMTVPELDFNDTENGPLDITRRGFTDHEHLDQFELIHMNGRMYDFNNGRFLSVDPFIHGVTSQGINPYSYILNNPLSGTDPTGYIPDRCIVDCERHKKPAKRPEKKEKRGKLKTRFPGLWNGVTSYGNKAKSSSDVAETESQSNIINDAKMLAKAGRNLNTKCLIHGVCEGEVHIPEYIPVQEGGSAILGSIGEFIEIELTNPMNYVYGAAASAGAYLVYRAGKWYKGIKKTNGEKITKGRLKIDPDGDFSQSEIDSAYFMASRGANVHLRRESTVDGVRTTDLVVDGIPYDVYTPTTSNLNNIMRNIKDKNGQANGQSLGVVLDLRKSTATQDQLGDIVGRLRGNGYNNILEVIVLDK
ncbi:RHS repeat-associated core domain-containing protein [Marinicella sediminis]|uniref:RHS repeat-associated core domain-containing protein n=1 Tax=Marinicella sediminis TaxID=1792834 RepID=A0ABV7J9T0_9GAMM|nr:RHS repeat-associated core domain-containing protein [Marinicella sediminis]